jgi:predicted kinase
MKQLYLIRGLPGSGKTTLAKQIAEEYYEADAFFLDEQGNYIYDKEKIKEAHEYCQANTKDAMLHDVETIAVSNTFVRRWEMFPYLAMAKEFGYTVTEITLSGPLHGNIHQVPVEIIGNMKTNWEI